MVFFGKGPVLLINSLKVGLQQPDSPSQLPVRLGHILEFILKLVVLLNIDSCSRFISRCLVVSEQYFEFAIDILEESQLDMFVGNRLTDLALLSLMPNRAACLRPFSLFFGLLVLHLLLYSCLYVHTCDIGSLNALVLVLEQHIGQLKPLQLKRSLGRHGIQRSHLLVRTGQLLFQHFDSLVPSCQLFAQREHLSGFLGATED